MPRGNDPTTRFRVDISELRAGMSDAQRQIRLATAEFQASTSRMDEWGTTADGVSAKISELNRRMDAEKQKLALLSREYAAVSAEQGETSAAAENLRIRILNQQAAIGRISGEINQYTGRLDGLRQAQGQEVESIRDETSAMDRLRLTIQNQQVELDQLRNRYASLTLEQNEESDEARSLAAELQRLSRELSENRGALQDAESAADQFSGSLEDSEESSSEMAELGASVLRVALVKLAVEGIKVVVAGLKDLVTAQSEASASFQAATGATTKSMSQYNKEMQELYKNNYGESLQDIAESMAEVKQQTGEVDPSKLQELTESAIALRDTFGYEIKESVRATNMLMQQFGLTSDEAFNMIVQGAQNGLDKNDDLIDTINEYSVQFADSGDSAEDFFNRLKNSADQGSWSVDKSADAWKEFTLKVRNGDVGDQLKKLGLNAKEMSKEFVEGGKSGNDASTKIIEALKGIANPLKQYRIGTALFGTMWEDMGTDATLAMSDVSGSIDKTKKSMEEMKSVKYNDVGSKFTELGRLIRIEFLEPIANKVIPIITEIATTAIENIPKIKQLFIDGKKAIEDWIPAIAGVGAAIATYLVVTQIAAFITMIRNGTLALKAMTLALKAMTLAQAALNVVMSLNPIGIIIGLIAGLVTGFILMWNKSEAFRNFWISLWDKIKETVSGAINGIITFFTKTVPEAFNGFIASVGEFITGIGMFFVELPGKIRDWLLGVLTTIAEWAVSLKDKAVEAGSNFVNGVVEFFTNLPYKIGYVLGLVIGNIAKWIISTTLKAAEAGTKFVNTVIKFFKELPGKTWNWLVNTIARISQWGINAKNKASETGRGFVNNVVSFVRNLPGRVWTFLVNTIAKATTWGTNMVTKAKDAGTKFVNKVIEFVKNLPAKVWKWLNDTITKAATFVSDMAKKGTEAAKGLFDNIVDGVSKLPGEMLEIGKNIVEGIWDGIVSAKDAFVGHVNGFFSGIVDGAKDALGIHSPSRVFRDQVGKQIVAGLVEGMESRASTAVTAVRKISQDMADSIASTDFSISGQLVMDQIRQARDIIAGATSGGIGGGVNGVYQTVAESANYNYNFYQTNNSPKSLSRYEIYRQTKNQLKFAAGR